MKKSADINKIAAKRSTNERTSPVKAKRPFMNSSPALNIINCVKGGAPKAKKRNVIAATRSIAPRTLTIIVFYPWWGIRSFAWQQILYSDDIYVEYEQGMFDRVSR